MATEYLGVKQVAERLGITSGGLLNLKLPEPDAMIGRTRGWLPSTIDEWNRSVPDAASAEEDPARAGERLRRESNPRIHADARKRFRRSTTGATCR